MEIRVSSLIKYVEMGQKFAKISKNFRNKIWFRNMIYFRMYDSIFWAMIIDGHNLYPHKEAFEHKLVGTLIDYLTNLILQTSFFSIKF